MGEDLFRAFVGFFAVVDPIGNILVFEAVAGRAGRRERLGIALLAVAVAFGLIVLFAFTGDLVLEQLDIAPASFQIAAGVLLVLPAMRMVERGELLDVSYEGRAPRSDAAVVPLALPMMSGPGALALATQYAEQFGADVVLAASSLVLLISFALFMAATFLLRVLHPAALRAIARIVGVLLMAIAVDFIVSGWQASQA